MKHIFLSAALCGAALSAQAADAPPAMIEFAAAQAQAWVAHPVVISAIKAQNAKNGGLSEAEILSLDTQWRDELKTNTIPMIDAILALPVSQHLREHTEASGGQITEVFVMDQVGLNVGQSGITSDYWQGDEAKFQQTYPMGAGAMHVSDVELDESTQTYQAQVSMTITDPESNMAIGAVTFGINVDGFF
jgi:hypothetical protein